MGIVLAVLKLTNLDHYVSLGHLDGPRERPLGRRRARDLVRRYGQIISLVAFILLCTSSTGTRGATK